MQMNFELWVKWAQCWKQNPETLWHEKEENPLKRSKESWNGVIDEEHHIEWHRFLNKKVELSAIYENICYQWKNPNKPTGKGPNGGGGKNTAVSEHVWDGYIYIHRIIIYKQNYIYI